MVKILILNMGIINLTRKFLPKLSIDRSKNIANINSMPEMVLSKMIQNGDRSIVHVDMNQCVAALINSQGKNTIYTDALWGCNSVGIVTKTLKVEPMAILSHYVPTAVDKQSNAIEKQLQTYAYYADKKYKPQVFFNIRGVEENGKLEVVSNPIVEKVKTILAKFFPQGVETTIIPYPTKNRSSFFSSANIYQFDPVDLNSMKITFVGEKEKFVDLMM